MSLVSNDGSLCKQCANKDACPRNFDLTLIKHMFHCNYFVSDEFPPEKALIHPFNVQFKAKKKDISSSEKKEILMEIMAKRKEQRHMLRTYCKKCKLEMDKVISIRLVFYRCPNFPKCENNADPAYVSQAVLDDAITLKEFDEVKVKYEFDYDQNIVWVEEI
ncbi:hypothetical protein NEF87_003984 [Candidatus Lokiarchaeum ossiferum]|uniref:DNA topoisomerase type IA zn finger domain-containing protein n=1 Tax=Candidatus Lokiarchaeum ossiferum TaxID=2951803 RepID=A0ABY6HZ25_9ARCH|nr:hypothetical protein NEF87_003984 [Candidatus Lokiarchaeum sp. B-35]